MLTKEEWLENFELGNGRKPLPKEFVTARKNGEFTIAEQVALKETEVQEESAEESVLEEVTQVSSEEDYNVDSKPKKFCQSCGQANGVTSDFCTGCGAGLNFTNGQKSLFADFSARFTDISLKAAQKTKDLTQGTQLNAQIYIETRKRENLFKELGKAYYEAYHQQPEKEFETLFEKIAKIDEVIEGIKQTKI